MNRWILFLAAPYVVTVSSQCQYYKPRVSVDGLSFKVICDEWREHYEVRKGTEMIHWCSTREVCEDHAEALNMDRERRDRKAAFDKRMKSWETEMDKRELPACQKDEIGRISAGPCQQK